MWLEREMLIKMKLYVEMRHAPTVEKMALYKQLGQIIERW